MRVVLLNPMAQGGRAAQWEPALRAALPTDVDLHVPADMAAGLGLLRSLPTGSRVVLAGGDGTLHRWLPALIERDHELGVVPLGSGNDLARALGLQGRPPQEWLSHALNGPATWHDLGLARWFDEQGTSRETPFISSLCTGFDAAVAQRALHGPARLGGRLRHTWAALRELASLRTWSMDITVDGEHCHAGPALMASTLNTPTFGAGLPATPGARTHDGLLNLLLARPLGRAGTLGLLLGRLLGRHPLPPRVRTQAFEAMLILTRGDLPLAADGEWLGLARSLTVLVRPAALRVVGRP